VVVDADDVAVEVAAAGGTAVVMADTAGDDTSGRDFRRSARIYSNSLSCDFGSRLFFFDLHTVRAGAEKGCPGPMVRAAVVGGVDGGLTGVCGSVII
jgi:hypothetical protein